MGISSTISQMLDRYGVADQTRRYLEQTAELFINGEYCESSNSARIDVIEPSTGAVLSSIPAANSADVDRAVDAANQALKSGPWSSMKPNERQRILLKLADLIERDAQILGEIETLDNGKALQPCIEVDILGGADLLRYMAGFATKIDGATREVSAPGNHLAMTLREPIGVVGAIVPWNWPFNMAMWKLAAPLAVGCTVVLKPAEQTSLSILYFMRLCQEAGLPAGVINIVTGTGEDVGAHLTSHPGINKVSFTGSTPVGRQVGASAAAALSPATLELGGKSPMIAFADADFGALAEAARWSVFFNTGQVCSAGSRLYVERSCYDEAIAELKKVVSAMKLRPGLDPECDIGPVVSAEQKARILTYLELAREEGAAAHYDANPQDGDGFFVGPAILGLTDNRARVVQEEIFGPVLVVLPFDSESEALKLANDNEYALAASVWTKDIHRALRVVRQLDAGTVWVNTHDQVDSAMPFGGFKSSGFGKDLGPEQLEHFLRTKVVWLSVG